MVLDNSGISIKRFWDTSQKGSTEKKTFRYTCSSRVVNIAW